MCEGSLALIDLGDEEGLNVLEELKVDTTSLESIKAAINRRKTAIDLMDARQSAENKGEAVKYEDMIASVELQLGYQLKLNGVSLSRWVGILNTLKKKREAEKAAIKNSKSGR